MSSPERPTNAALLEAASRRAQPVGKQLDPSFDVYSCVTPFLMQAMQKYPTGKAPRRGIPGGDKDGEGTGAGGGADDVGVAG